MQKFRSIRLILVAFLLSLVPASSFAGVFISVGFAPPILPVYDVPPCPEPGWIWTPGYWAYGPDGYYWVAGAWVPTPYEGALWTPGYWGWSSGQYIWHTGYWGNHVGYYGGINYGGGYFGIGFAGGEWRGRDFFYNTEVYRVGPGVRYQFRDRGYRDHAYVDRDRHIGFSGGPGGIRHEMDARERMAEHDRHVGATNFQMSHENHFRDDRSSYFRNNNGRPSQMGMERPSGWNAGGQQHGQPQNQQRPGQFQQQNNQNQQRPGQFQQQQNQQRPQFQQQQNNQNQQRPGQFQQQQQNQMQQRMQQPQQRPEQFQQQNQQRPQIQQQQAPQMQQQRPQPQSFQQHSSPQQFQQRSAPQAAPQAQPQRIAPQAQPQQHAAPAAQPQHGNEHERR
ncbi:MAG: YXWGXW repeat-containing protein [Terracidiphilus sp.]|nr:YXWGXW repeat-containing protein [Terracidiphilus sp.]